MDKLILVSYVLALMIVPAWAAGDPSGRRGLKKTIVGLIVYAFVYLGLVRFVVPRLTS
jgi:hypothetical protein